MHRLVYTTLLTLVQASHKGSRLPVILNEDTPAIIRGIGVSRQLAKMSFDEVFHLTAGAYFYFDCMADKWLLNSGYISADNLPDFRYRFQLNQMNRFRSWSLSINIVRMFFTLKKIRFSCMVDHKGFDQNSSLQATCDTSIALVTG